jgi:hypothetical protein
LNLSPCHSSHADREEDTDSASRHNLAALSDRVGDRLVERDLLAGLGGKIVLDALCENISCSFDFVRFG